MKETTDIWTALITLHSIYSDHYSADKINLTEMNNLLEKAFLSAPQKLIV